MNWQPIETAPKDGTEIDLWANGQRYTNTRWSVKKGLWEWFYIDGFDGMGWVSMDYPPTHWMPLPEPPSGTLENS